MDAQVKGTLAVDLDGTILRMNLARWHREGMDYFGTPMPGVKKALKVLRELGLRIVIHTCRMNPMVATGHTLPEMKKTIEDALDELNIPYDEVYDGVGKPLADFYIDDRGIKFKTWSQVLYDLGVIKE